jgi:EmrB/QacA subfamily drug resistance transporter
VTGLVWLAFADLGVAIPTIADDLGSDALTLQWANNAFSLVCGALVIAAGRFGDELGRRRVLEVGVVLFAACAVVGALAGGVGVLIAGRALMGIGAALILPTTLGLIPAQFSGRAALTAFGAWQATAWGGQAVAPTIGGVVTEAFGWRWLFWLNLPIALVALLVIRAVTPEARDADGPLRIDVPGMVTIGLAAFCLLYALTEGPDAGWGDPLVVALAVGAVVAAAAWWVVEARASYPLVDLSLFRRRTLDGALVANLLANLLFAGLMFLLVLWLQDDRGYDPLQAGLLTLPSAAGIVAGIPAGNRLNAAIGARRPTLLGLVVIGTGVGLLGLLDDQAPIALVGVALLIVGLGVGIMATPISSAAVGGVPEALAGTAAGVFKMSSMVGGAVGVALFTGLDHELSVGASAIVMALLALVSTLVVVAVWPAASASDAAGDHGQAVDDPSVGLSRRELREPA